MANIALTIGVVLILLGVGGYLATSAASPTALIPSVFGLLLALCGFLARQESRRKTWMHAAVLVALLGLLGSFSGILQTITLLSGGEVARPAAAVSRALMALLCLVFVALAVNSFIQARRSRS